MMTTSNGFDGYYVQKYCGIVTNETIFRSGIVSSVSANIKNFVSTLTFKDTEFKGSMELIEKAKEFLLDGFRTKAYSLGANAILGIDFETSLGENICRVSVSGTAVIIAPNAAVIVEKDVDRKYCLPVKASNMNDPFLLNYLYLTPGKEGAMISCELKSFTQEEIGDLSAKVVLYNKFEDSFEIPNICFINMRKKKEGTYLRGSAKAFYESGDMYCTEIPVHILAALSYCKVSVRKYFIGSRLFEPETLELAEVKEKSIDQIPEQIQMYSLDDLFKQFSEMKSASEMSRFLESVEDKVDADIYSKLYRCLLQNISFERNYGADPKSTIISMKNLLEV